MKAEVCGRRSRRRQKKRWSDMMQQDLVTLRLKPEDAADRDKWSRRTHPRGLIQTEGEREEGVDSRATSSGF